MARQDASATPDTSGHCPEGNDDGRRLNDLAEHVHDAAVSEYLRQNVVAFGREPTPRDAFYAMLLLDDDASYELCVTVPERCLRAKLRRAESNAERDALLSNQGAYAYERALACLQRTGDAYAAREPEPTADPAELDAAYRERVLPHLVGNMMPVALLSESNFFGADNAELHAAAVIAWHECYDRLASEPLNPEQAGSPHVARRHRHPRMHLGISQKDLGPSRVTDPSSGAAAAIAGCGQDQDGFRNLRTRPEAVDKLSPAPA